MLKQQIGSQYHKERHQKQISTELEQAGHHSIYSIHISVYTVSYTHLDVYKRQPEDRSVCKFRRRVGRQHDLRMDNAAFPGVVMGHSIPFICQLGSAAVSSCGNGRTARAALDDTDGDMTEIYGEHLLSVRG